MKTIIALYDDRQAAEDAAQNLLSAGIPSDRVTVESQEARSSAASSAPKEKPGFLKRLFGLGVDNDNANLYAEGVNRGSTLVTVIAGDDDDDSMIEQSLQRYDPIDIDTRASTWREQGWAGSKMAGDRADVDTDMGMDAAENRGTEAEARIPIVEEKLSVGKESVATGGVRVRSFVQRIPVAQDVELDRERVSVERRPVSDMTTTTADAGAFEERSILVETFEERPVVQKDAAVVEEVIVKKDIDTRTETIRDDVKRTVVDVDDEAKRSPSGR